MFLYRINANAAFTAMTTIDIKNQVAENGKSPHKTVMSACLL